MIRNLSDDQLATCILDALFDHNLTHDEVIAPGDNPNHAAVVLEPLQMIGVVKSYCGPIQPSTCKNRLAGKV